MTKIIVIALALNAGCGGSMSPRYPEVPVANLPKGAAPAPVPFPHFPDRVHAVVWRNWELIEPARIARVIRATTSQVLELAESMGLPPAAPISEHIARRSYITVIRHNWHLLPYEQLLELLDWEAGRMAFVLREDDFLYAKLGQLKPACPPVHYAPPSPDARRRAGAIREVVRKHFGGNFPARKEEPFAFLRDLSAAPPPRPARRSAPGNLRLLYSYFALYGDPLLQSDCDPYPDGYLERLAQLGVNGIWLQGLLHQLHPWSIAPELSRGFEERVANLRKLIARANLHGIGVYLYLNEPRGMPLAFFERRPELRGVTEGENASLCTSVPAVRDFIRDSVAAVVKAAPGLAGFFTITASENLTSCVSHFRAFDCARCKDRPPAQIVAEVNRLIAGAAPGMRVLAWDWGWKDEWAEEAIAALPQECWLMSVSEWSLPIDRGGVKSAVGEYSISAVGPGPRATRHWAAARKRGMKTVAKVQINNSWELSAVPYIPVLDLVAEHVANLAKADVDGLMLGWTLGGYPSPNLAVAAGRPLDSIAAPEVRRAWKRFSDAFREFPYDVGVLYRAPQQFGPANLLWREPTGYASTMIGFPYDDLNGWRAIYPPDVFRSQMEKLAAAWGEGFDGISLAAHLHFKSVASQIAFVQSRAGDWTRCRQILLDEIDAARRLFDVVNADSRIGFEATNHYYYTRLDLVEKIVNCENLLSP